MDKAAVIMAPSQKANASAVQAALGITDPPSFPQFAQVLSYNMISVGDADVYVKLPKSKQEFIWDHAANTVIAEEAGGSVTDLFGRSLDFSHGCQLAPNNKGFVASAGGALHTAVLEALQSSQSAMFLLEPHKCYARFFSQGLLVLSFFMFAFVAQLHRRLPNVQGFENRMRNSFLCM
eukprot:gnl/TRDRNA2_/TRDRNA2_126934_c0_seq3.p1 gnl/TRDRNA2_/TRDRNA2_126934_c0~~gnl/TRDRNA2_/TRDRNA2_126934_c0_seq3.p1  ORF type:complete len:178 (+),score=22.30 gnl/TRDRNA2_/TRDRNA2_126934_c0_seq3:630-1163(+)